MPPVFHQPPLNRMPQQLGPEYYKSYTMSMPLSSHWRKVTCEQYECDAWKYGFVLDIDVSTELGQKQFYYVTHDKSRKYSMQRPSLNQFKFVYPPGNAGFAGPQHDHYLPLGREPIFLVRGGDWRGNPRKTPTRVHAEVGDWVEDFAENQDYLAQIAQRG